MLSIVPYPMRIKAAAMLAAALAVTSAGCASATESAGPITPVSVDCANVPGPGAVEGVLTDLEGFTVTEICASEAFAVAASAQFDSVAAGLVSQDGNQILRVLVGQVKSGNADAFLSNYVADLSEQQPEGGAVPSEKQQLGEHLVTHFNVPLSAEGYAYTSGPTVVIAYIASGSPPATVDDALTKIIDELLGINAATKRRRARTG